jgi:hypothetical protein
LHRAQRVRQFCQLVTAGRLPDVALRRVGLTWWQLARAVSEDHTGDLQRHWDAAQRFGAHALAAQSVRVAGSRRIRSMPEATALGHRIKALQWLAGKLNPERYGTAPAPVSQAAVVHHVIHLPQRGPAPDLRQIAVVGAVDVIGSPDRQLPSGSGATV